MKSCAWPLIRRAIVIHLPLLVCLALGQWQAALVVFAITFVVMTYGVLCPTTRLFGPVTIHLPGPGVLITIDDGPDPSTTPTVLDLLDQHQAKAVFFLIGDRVRKWPHLAQEIAARGHAIGNHSQTHPAATFWTLGPWRMWREIHGCQQTSAEVLGSSPTWFRAPVGHYNAWVNPVIQALGLRLMSWSCRGFDGTDGRVDKVLQRIRKDLKPGAVILLHESVPHSAAVLEGVLRELQARGLKPVPLAEALPDAAPQ